MGRLRSLGLSGAFAFRLSPLTLPDRRRTRRSQARRLPASGGGAQPRA
jgi:hypothetical protein